jgi:hypothetical protein
VVPNTAPTAGPQNASGDGEQAELDQGADHQPLLRRTDFDHLRGCLLGKVGPVHSRQQLVDANGDRRRRARLLQRRTHLLDKDALGDGIRYVAFQTIADVDAHAAFLVVRRQHQQHAVIDPLAAQLPGGEYALGKILDGLRCPFANSRERDEVDIGKNA